MIENLELVYRRRATGMPERPVIVNKNIVNVNNNRQTKLNNTKLNNTKVETVELAKLNFEEYVEELRPQFTDINFDVELKKFHLYWSEGGRKLKRPKLALLNWMTIARERKQEKGGQGGAHRANLGTRQLPKTYRTPEEIFGKDDG